MNICSCIARGRNLISYNRYHLIEYSASNCSHTIHIHICMHTHTLLHIPLYVSSRSREYIDNHCHNLHLAMNACQDAGPSNTW